jgi:hypothetical protein
MTTSQPMTLFADADLTIDERAELEFLENRIEQALTIATAASITLATCLDEIHSKKLYKAYGTLDNYCRERWQRGRQWGYQLIEAARTMRNLMDSENVRRGVQMLPESERQVRPLAKLEPEQQREAWSKAIETAPNGKVTAAHVQSVVDSYDEQAEELAEDEEGYDWTEDESEPVNIEDANGHVETMWAQPEKMAVHFSSDTPEHYTPKEIINAVIECMGAIDLDPCSNSWENPNVPAGFHFTQDVDGLSRHWAGRVFMNPPYGREISKWVDKLCAEYKTGHVTEAIALVPARTDTDWFDKLIDGYKFHCFVHGRLVFIGNDNSAPFPSAIVYFGTEWGRFYAAFRPFGRIVQETNPEMFGD